MTSCCSRKSLRCSAITCCCATCRCSNLPPRSRCPSCCGSFLLACCCSSAVLRAACPRVTCQACFGEEPLPPPRASPWAPSAAIRVEPEARMVPGHCDAGIVACWEMRRELNQRWLRMTACGPPLNAWLAWCDDTFQITTGTAQRSTSGKKAIS